MPGANRSAFRVRLALIGAGGSAVRIVYALSTWGSGQPPGDGAYYHGQAMALRDGLGFIDPLIYAVLGDELDAAHHPPLYTVVLAVGSLFTGRSPAGLRVLSGLLGALAVVLIGLLARRLAGGPGKGDRPALIAAGIAAVYPNLWVNDALLLSESLYAPLIAGLLLCAYRLRDDPRPGEAALFGLVLGLAVLTRAEAIVLVPLIVVPVVLLLRSLDLRARLTLGAVTCAVAGFVMAPWVVHNLLRFEEPVMLSYGIGGVLPQANCDQTYSGELLGYWSSECLFPGPGDGIAPEGDYCRTHLVECAELYQERFRDESEGAEYGRELGMTYIREHKDRLPVVAAARFGRIWELYRPGQNIELNTVVEHRGLWNSRLGLVMFYELMATGAVGLILLRRRGTPIYPLVAMAVMVTGTAVLAIPVVRYRVPVEIVLCALGGIAVDAAIRWWRRAPATRRSSPAEARA